MTETPIDWKDVPTAAAACVNNHAAFEDFWWHDAPKDAERWFIYHTESRDSDLLEKSNAHVFDEELGRFSDAFVRAQHFNHWGFGWVDGYAIKVYKKDGSVSKAFKKFCELMAALQDYPVLDDEDYSRREYEATLENISSEGERFKKDNAPEDWKAQVFSWLWDNEQKEVLSHDDSGGYPTRAAVKRAMIELDLHEGDLPY